MKTSLAPELHGGVDRDQTFFVLVAAALAAVFIIIWSVLLGDGHPKQAEQAAYIWFLLSVPVLTLIGWAVALRFHARRAEGTASILLWTLLYAAIPALVLGIGLQSIARVIYYSYDAVPRSPPYSLLRFVVGARERGAWPGRDRTRHIDHDW